MPILSKKKIFDTFLKIVSKVTNKKFTYLSNSQKSFPVAVKSKYGFWYCGDIFDQADIAYGIASKGTVEAFDTEVVVSILKKLKPDFTFYDIGSNTGWYTMIASTINDTSKVYSFEPIIEHVNYQKETISLNRKENQVNVFEIALSDHTGIETIRLAGSGTTLENDFLEVDFGVRKISVKTLDEMIVENNIPNPDFIKIDVEGHEYKVLQGAQKMLKQETPILFVELAKTFNHIHFTNKTFEKTFLFLSELGYSPYIVNNNHIKKFDPSTDIDGVHMYLFLHKEKHLKKIDLASILSSK
jgi:FkbM family methyltransferase